MKGLYRKYIKNICNYIPPSRTEIMNYCCQDMAMAVDKGTIHFSNLLDKNDDILFNTFYIEAIKNKEQKNRFIFKTTEVVTDDIILKYCCFCGGDLSVK